MDPAFFFEMPALDMQRAKGFYERAFGWRILTSYENFYFALTTESDAARNPQILGAINGAIQRKDETMGALRLLIGVEDLDVAIKKVLARVGASSFRRRRYPATTMQLSSILRGMR